jgi:hypothetical protein
MNRKSSKSITAIAVGAVMLASAIAPAGAEVKRLTALYTEATPGSPAQFRIHEELDRFAAGEAAPPSAAAFRLAEMKSR